MTSSDNTFPHCFAPCPQQVVTRGRCICRNQINNQDSNDTDRKPINPTRDS